MSSSSVKADLNDLLLANAAPRVVAPPSQKSPGADRMDHSPQEQTHPRRNNNKEGAAADACAAVEAAKRRALTAVTVSNRIAVGVMCAAVRDVAQHARQSEQPAAPPPLLELLKWSIRFDASSSVAPPLSTLPPVLRNTATKRSAAAANLAACDRSFCAEWGADAAAAAPPGWRVHIRSRPRPPLLLQARQRVFSASWEELRHPLTGLTAAAVRLGRRRPPRTEGTSGGCCSAAAPPPPVFGAATYGALTLDDLLGDD